MAVRPGAWLPLTALGIFLAEAVAFIGLGELIGYGWAVLAVVAASALGLILVSREGSRAWRRFRQAAQHGQPPGPQVANGMVGLSGALLLAMPGLVSGVAGLILLAPPVRAVARERIQSRAERRMSSPRAGQMFGPRRARVWQPDASDAAGPEEVVEGEVIDPGRPPREPGQ